MLQPWRCSPHAEVSLYASDSKNTTMTMWIPQSTAKHGNRSEVATACRHRPVVTRNASWNRRWHLPRERLGEGRHPKLFWSNTAALRVSGRWGRRSLSACRPSGNPRAAASARSGPRGAPWLQKTTRPTAETHRGGSPNTLIPLDSSRTDSARGRKESTTPLSWSKLPA